jgi:hypothetical protein
MRILGVEEKGRQGTILKAELQKIGFRLSDLEFVSEIQEDDKGWYMLFGSPALKEYVGSDVRMADVSGQILCCDWNPDALIVPNYAPGFLYHNPNMKGLWVDNLKLAFIAYQLDEKGLVA